ncbi:MAG: hypothetical protein PHF51_02790 [Candidatus ainarchaeum sp.]|nr:hypothetical protein [Candidatus ainarchaeum sp.]
MIDYAFAAAAMILSAILPGVLLALPFAKKLGASRGEAAILGAGAGLVAVPSLGFAESLLGIPFSFEVAAFNSLAALFAGAFLCIRSKALSGFRLPATGEDAAALAKENWHWLALAAIVASAFALRSTSAQPFVFEADPYYYLRAAQFIVQDGGIPASDDLAWAPQLSTHRERPLTLYLQAQTFEVSGFGSPFDKTGFYLASSVYPPIVGALACLMAFLLVSREWGPKWGVLAAWLVAFTPEIIYNFQAGGFEQQPWGLFALLFFAAAYAGYLKNGGKANAFLCALALFGAVAGSKQDVLALGVFAAMALAESARKILSGNRIGGEFVEDYAIIAAGGVAAFLVMLPYRSPGFTPLIISCAAFAFPAAAWAVSLAADARGKRLRYCAILAALAAAALLATPAGPYLFRYVAEQRFFGETPGLFTTVAEESAAPQNLRLYLGFLGIAVGSAGLQNLLLASSAILLVFAALYRGSKAALLVLALSLPLAYFGYQREKFVVHLALALAVIVSAALGEAAKFAGAIAEKSRPPPLQFSLDIGEGTADKVEAGRPLSLRLPLMVASVGALLAFAQLAWIYGDLGASRDPAFMTGGALDCAKLANATKRTAYLLECYKIGSGTVSAMDWIEANAGGSSVLSWWDYGHWINYLGQAKTVIRGDLYYPATVLSAADALASGDSSKLASLMEEGGARYLYVTSGELAKWDAVSYLACTARGETSAPFSAQKSECEKRLQFEYLYLPLNAEVPRCANVTGSPMRLKSSYNNTYCVSAPSAGGGGAQVYSLDGTPVDAGLQSVGKTGSGQGAASVLLVLYGRGSVSQAPGQAYSSNFYRGFYLRELPGFTQAYPEGGDASDTIIMAKN